MQHDVSPASSTTSARLFRPAVVVVAALGVVSAGLMGVSALVDGPDRVGVSTPGDVVTAVAPEWTTGQR